MMMNLAIYSSLECSSRTWMAKTPATDFNFNQCPIPLQFLRLQPAMNFPGWTLMCPMIGQWTISLLMSSATRMACLSINLSHPTLIMPTCHRSFTLEMPRDTSNSMYNLLLRNINTYHNDNHISRRTSNPPVTSTRNQWFLLLPTVLNFMEVLHDILSRWTKTMSCMTDIHTWMMNRCVATIYQQSFPVYSG